MKPHRLLVAALPLALAACGDPVVLKEYFTVLNVSPSHGAVNIGVNADMRVTFSHPVDPGSLDGAVLLTDATEEAVSASVTLSEDNYTVLVLPDAELSQATSYALTLSAALSSDSVGALPTDIRTLFTTEGLSPGGNSAPQAVIEALSESCNIGEPYVLSGGGSYDPEGADLVYAWRVVDSDGDEPPALEDVDAEEATLFAFSAGRVVVGLVVSDGAAMSSEAFLEIDCAP